MDIDVYYVVYLASPCEGKDEQEEEEKGAGWQSHTSTRG